MGTGKRSLDSENRKPHLAHQELYHPMVGTMKITNHVPLLT